MCNIDIVVHKGIEISHILCYNIFYGMGGFKNLTKRQIKLRRNCKGYRRQPQKTQYRMLSGDIKGKYDKNYKSKIKRKRNYRQRR